MTDTPTDTTQSSRAARDSGRQSLLWFLTGIAIAFTLYAGVTLERMRQATDFPYQLDAEEGFILNQALRLVSRQGLYKPIAEPPYLMDNYPPLYPALWSVLARWTGPSLEGGRWLSALSAVAAALAVGAIVWSMTRFAPLAWLCPAIALSGRSWLRWSAYARVDVLAVALTLWGLALFVLSLRAGRGREERGRAWRAASIVLFVLALFTKQTVVAAPAACLLWLLLRDRRAAIRFAAALVLAFAIPFGALCLATRGEFYLHLVTYNRNVMHWNELRWWTRDLVRFHYPIVFCVGILTLRRLWFLFVRRKPTGEGPSCPRELALGYLTLNAFSFLSLAKSGAAENYLLEPACAAAIFLGVELGDLTTRATPAPRRWANAAACAMVFCLLAWQAVRYAPIALWFLATAPVPTASALIQGDRVVREIRARPGDVLSEDPIYALKAGREVLFQNFIMTQLALEGKWDESPFVRRLEAGEFALIVAHQDLMNPNQFFDRYTPAMLDAIRRRYVPLAVLPRDPPLQSVFLYVPRVAE